jgi:hypothetical protein
MPSFPPSGSTPPARFSSPLRVPRLSATMDEAAIDILAVSRDGASQSSNSLRAS